ncbi:MAG: hypothetical protein QXE74_08985 [Candidatus Bathyarchaeia archaeon]
MSRTVIVDVVIPIVSKIMAEEGYVNPFWPIEIRDEKFIEFLEEEMRRHFGVIGSNGCQHLKEQLEEAKKNDPFAFEYLVKQLLRKYVKLSVMLRKAKKTEGELEGPPDRFAEFRRRYNQLFSQTT